MADMEVMINDEFDNEMIEDADIVVLSDDEGNEFTFEILDELYDDDDNHYVALLPVYDNPADAVGDSDPLVIMKQVDEGDESYFDEIVNEEEFDRISEIFSNRLSEIFDIQ